MPTLPAGSVDMILCDLPYGTTDCKWDSVIPFEPLWEQYKRLIKPRGAIVLTASQPFTSALVMSNPKWFRYEWIWNKRKAANFVLGNKMPLKIHENICVFYDSPPTYNPQKTKAAKPATRYLGKKSVYRNDSANQWGCREVGYSPSYEPDKKLPVSIQEISKDNFGKNIFHPTQKPVALMEYLIRTYTNEGESVLDNCMGSGTTGIACKNLNRHFIGIEKDPGYFSVAGERIITKQGLSASESKLKSVTK